MTDLSPTTRESHPELWAALDARRLLYQGDRPGGFIEGWAAAREYSKQREQETRLALDKVCAPMAVPDCSECQGDGIDYEGDEWCVCDCVLSKQREENLEREQAALLDHTHDVIWEHFEQREVKLRKALETTRATIVRANAQGWDATTRLNLVEDIDAALAENGDSEPKSDFPRCVSQDRPCHHAQGLPGVCRRCPRARIAQDVDPGGLGDRRPGA